MFGLGAFGQLALGQAPFTTVISDAAAQVEASGQFVRDEVLRDEMVFGVTRDAQAQIETTTLGVRSDSSVQMETAWLVRIDAAIVDEYQDVVRADWRPSVEFLESISSDADAGAKIEIIEKSLSDASSLGEIDAVVSSNWAVPTETLSGSPTVVVDGGAPLEILTSFAADAASSLEFTVLVKPIDAGARLESTVGVLSEWTAYIEFASPVIKVDGAALPEFLASLRIDGQVRTEFTVPTRVSDSSLPAEVLSELPSSSWSTPVEIVGNVNFIGDAGSNLDFLSGTSQGSLAWIDTLGQVSMFAGDGAVQIEIVQSVQYSDSALILEILQWAKLHPNRNELWSEEWSGLDTIGGF